MRRQLTAPLLGLGAGIVSGLFGVGGGVVVVPGLVLLLGFPQREPGRLGERTQEVERRVWPPNPRPEKQ